MGRDNLSGASGQAGFSEHRCLTLARHIGLAAEARTSHLQAIGNSDANIILSGDPERVMELWRETRGEGEDLSGVLPVMLSNRTEDFNRQWYARATRYGVTDYGSVFTGAVRR